MWKKYNLWPDWVLKYTNNGKISVIKGANESQNFTVEDPGESLSVQEESYDKLDYMQENMIFSIVTIIITPEQF